MSKAAFHPQALKRALIIKLRHHGDVLLAAPVLSALKRAAPHCEVDALVYADTAPMLEGHPALTQLHTIDRRWKHLGLPRQAGAEWRLLHSLRARRYDLVVHLSVHTRGAWLTRLLRPHLAVAPRRPGHRGESFWRASFTHFYAAQSHADRHTVESNLDALRALGLEPSGADKRVLLVPGAAAQAKVDAQLAALGLAPGRFIHLHPASRWAFKVWPAEKVAALCRELAQGGWPVLLTAAPEANEMALIDAIRKALGAASPAPSFALAGQLSLKELAALAHRARLFVGVDSAPMHIAAAMGTPTVGIFGPSGEREWAPWDADGQRHRVVASPDHPCRPCGRAGCNDSKISECLMALPVAAVRAACEELLTRPAENLTP